MLKPAAIVKEKQLFFCPKLSGPDLLSVNHIFA